jgi:hypothetical protein
MGILWPDQDFKNIHGVLTDKGWSSDGCGLLGAHHILHGGMCTVRCAGSVCNWGEGGDECAVPPLPPPDCSS